MSAAKDWPKYLKPYVKAAEKDGWIVQRTRNNHIQFRPPQGSPYPIIVASNTPSNHRSTTNFMSMAKKANIIPD